MAHRAPSGNINSGHRDWPVSDPALTPASVDWAAVVSRLAVVVGRPNVLTDPETLDRYSADALTPYRAYYADSAFERLADVVVRPAGTPEVSQIVGFAQQNAIPLIPYGGGTGVMGGVLPVRGGILLDMSRMNRLLSVSVESMTADVQAGMVLEDFYEGLVPYGLMPGHDPYSVPIATVAGTISTNGVGYRAAAFGPMGNQVVALEVVLPDGRVIETRAVPKLSSGPDLKHIFIGSEGVFGVITAATIKVFRIPEASAFATVEFDDFGAGFAAVGEMTALGIRPTLLDLTEDDEGILLHLLFEGFREGVSAGLERTLEVCRDEGGWDIGPQSALDYWRHRHDSAYNYRQNALGKPRAVRWERQWGRTFDYLHMSLPADRVLEYRKRADKLLEARGIQVVEYCVWSRPEFFSMLVVPSDGLRRGDRNWEDPEVRANLAAGVDEVLELAQDMGGIMEYCHGVGVKLNHLLGREQGPSRQVMQDLKSLLDPAGVMNPGKLGL